MKRLYKILLFSALFTFLMSFSIMAAGNYIKDDGSVLSKSTIDQVNTNFNKLQTNTGAVVRFQTIQSLNGKNIKDLANSIGNSAGTDRWAVLVVSIQDHKTEFVIGSGLNATFNSNEINRIVHIPDQYFKAKDFNGGILAAGKAIDQDITTKAVNTGNAVVKTDGMSTTVVPRKTSHFGTIAIISVLILSIIIIAIVLLQKRADKNIRKFKDKVNYHPSDNSGTFKSASLNNDTGWENVHKTRRTPNYVAESMSKPEKVVHHTTIVNSNNDRFVEGMLVNEMLHDHHHHSDYDSHDHHDSYDDNNSGSSNWSSNNDLTSGNWNSGSSDWSSSDSGSSSWGSSDSNNWDSGSSSGSDW